ncbi:hypothetical protein IMSAG013_00214 [Clostridiales bacterium]|nr:hypothetical protein IMSAG013_00214 [Clostridiales bacterium]
MGRLWLWGEAPPNLLPCATSLCTREALALGGGPSEFAALCTSLCTGEALALGETILPKFVVLEPRSG